MMTDKENYVMVDTTYMTKYAGNTYLKIIDTAKPAAGGMLYSSDGAPKGVSNWLRQDINGRLNFQFVWYPAQDSIVIRSAGFATLNDQTNDKVTSNFSDMNLSDDFLPATTDQNGKKDGAERNLIKIEVLGNGSHRELSTTPRFDEKALADMRRDRIRDLEHAPAERRFMDAIARDAFTAGGTMVAGRDDVDALASTEKLSALEAKLLGDPSRMTVTIVTRESVEKTYEEAAPWLASLAKRGEGFEFWRDHWVRVRSSFSFRPLS